MIKLNVPAIMPALGEEKPEEELMGKILLHQYYWHIYKKIFT